MKMGNTSLSVIPVPNFYMNRDLYNIESFNIKKKRYFKEKDLFKQVKDINVSNNPRPNYEKYELFNKTKYVPPHKKKAKDLNLKNENDTYRSGSRQNTEANEDYNNTDHQNTLTIPKEVFEYEKYEEYLKTHAASINHQDFKANLRDSINRIVDRVHSNYDINKYNAFQTCPDYLVEIKTRITSDDGLDSETHKFHSTLKNKITSLNIEKKERQKMLMSFVKNTESRSNINSDVKSLRSTGYGLNYKDKLSTAGTTFNIPKISKIRSGETISTIKSVENKEYNIKIPTLTFNSMTDTGNGGFNFNKKEGLCRSYQPSLAKLTETRGEFSKKQAEKVSFRRVEAKAEQDIIDNEMIDPRKYNSFKYRDIYCERLEKAESTVGSIFQNKEKDSIVAFLK